MANTKKILSSGPGHAGVLELGASGETVQVAAGADLAVLDIGAITASSTDSQSAGTSLSYTVNAVTSGADTHAVTLPAASTGKVRIVQVTTGAYAVKVYPASGDNINGGSANAAVVCKEATMQLFVPVTATQWSWLGTVNS